MIDADWKTKAREAFGYFFTIGKWAKEVMPTEDINRAIEAIDASYPHAPITQAGYDEAERKAIYPADVCDAEVREEGQEFWVTKDENGKVLDKPERRIVVNNLLEDRRTKLLMLEVTSCLLEAFASETNRFGMRWISRLFRMVDRTVTFRIDQLRVSSPR
jgi:hypothetical protein